MAVALGYVLYRYRQPLGELRAGLLERLRGVRQSLTSGTERSLREDLLRFAQTQHLAGSLFALNDILLPPRLWVSPPLFDPTQPPPDVEVTSVIPVLPDWPELAAIYRAATLSPAEALAGGASLVILGAPGSGKTTLLAHLASRAAQGDTAIFPDEPTPVFVHAADLALGQAPNADAAQPLITAALARASALTAARLPRHLQSRLPAAPSLILLDGLDELPGSQVAEVAAWLYFFSTLGDLTPLVARRLSQNADLLNSDLMACAVWLRDAPPNARWRGEVFKRLNRLLMDPNQPARLRLRALGAFVSAADPSIGALFKQGLSSPDPLVRQGSVSGLGTLGEISYVPQIAAQFRDPSLDVRWAAVLALSALPHESSLEALAQGLLSGDDNLRRACAEALARNEEEGHPVLKEAIAHDDLSVRRAAVYGLAATTRDWAIGLLEKLQHTEQQWLVRTAAQDVLTRLREPGSQAPRPHQPPESLGWLIAWANQPTRAICIRCCKVTGQRWPTPPSNRWPTSPPPRAHGWRPSRGPRTSGEHASLCHAWIQGAIESGLREAQAINAESLI